MNDDDDDDDGQAEYGGRRTCCGGGDGSNGNTGVTDSKGKVSPVVIFKSLVTDPALVLLFVAASIRMGAGFTFNSYVPKYFALRFPENSQEYSIGAVVSCFLAVFGNFAAGVAADRWSKIDNRAHQWIPALSCLLGSIPCALIFFFPFKESIALYAVTFLIAECWIGCSIATLTLRVAPQARDMSMSMFMFFAYVVGNVAPLLIGLLVNINSESEFRLALAYLLPSMYGFSGVLMVVVGFLSRRCKPAKDRIPVF